MDEAVAAWTEHWEANRDEALPFRAELGRLGGRVPAEWRAKVPGLSAALTDPAFSCAHYGDSRYCPKCAAEPTREAVRGLEDKLRDKTATVERQSDAIEHQSKTIASQSDEIQRLREEKQRLRARLAAQAPRPCRRRFLGRQH